MFTKAESFEFYQYGVDWKNFSFRFLYRVHLNDGKTLDFCEQLQLPDKEFAALELPPYDITDKVLQSLHLILGISYYKLFCPPKISIKNYLLSKEQADFWNVVYTKGLGEFFYKNYIDFRNLIKFPYDHNLTVVASDWSRSERALIALGGGKDSIVSARILQAVPKIKATAFMLNAKPLQRRIVEKLQIGALEAARILDPRLFELNKSQFSYDGHIPISAIYAFTALFAAVLYDYKYLIFSHERSSSFGNVDYLGVEINHQWSKSVEFEGLFRNYISQFITAAVEYFSILRPFYEIEIVSRFAHMKSFHQLFSSCNINFKLTDRIDRKRWCGHCPKCAFVFCLMAAFLRKSAAVAIFGKNLYADEGLIKTYRQLLGLEAIKPFECVGTPEETKMAFFMAFKKGEYRGDIIMNMFEKEVLPDIEDIAVIEREVFSYGDDSNIPSYFRPFLKL